MDKKDYIDAINEIEANDELRRKTFEKIKEKKSYSKRIYTIATAMIVFVIAISIAIPLNNNKNTVNPIEVVAENNGLPKLENFENLYNIIKNSSKGYYNGIMVENAVISDAATGTTEILDSAQSTNKTESSLKEEVDYSNTNVQVEGVDEADIVKTDGNYIYYVTNNKVIIVNAQDEKKLKIVSEIQYEDNSFNPRELFIAENKLIVIGTLYEDYSKNNLLVDSIYPISNQKTVAKIYKTENKEKPELVREITIEGNYLSSRMIGDNVYFIANKYMYSYLFRNKEIEELDEEYFKPKYTDTVVGTTEQCIAYPDIYYFPESEDTSYLNIAGFNINNNEPANIESYLGAGEDIYSSENNLYITKVKYEYKDSKLYGYYNNYDVNTYIYKFKLEDSKITYINAGSVPGVVLNQFSMDEKDGYFRIATTDSDNWNNETDRNNLYVLNEKLEIVGKVEGLAKGEKIYSVRFMGNRAYMVTFVETDPLFVIDLSEPTNPVVLGELKIPGYSKYLHPYDENHIIGFGENTRINEYGGVITDGMKMALFDVTNPTNPKELYSVDIGEKGTYSELLNNHKALLFSKEKNIIAFPVSISEEVGNYRTNLKFQGAIVYGLDLEKGFTLRGTIAHMQVQEGYRNYDYEKAVERIIYIKDNLYTLSKRMIKSTNMNTMEEQNVLEI
ncbi:MAG: beta-propeller domain-containing protein [Clostridia bacterium]|nr:beta-propeller domain-containing protein [Clostridia bacterium]